MSFAPPAPCRNDMPGGRPVALHVYGALPPEKTAKARSQSMPIVQSSRLPTLPVVYAVGETCICAGGVLTTSSAKLFVYVVPLETCTKTPLRPVPPLGVPLSTPFANSASPEGSDVLFCSAQLNV